MSAELQKHQPKELTFLSQQDIQKYTDVDNKVGELISSGLTGMAMAFAKVTVVEAIENVLDEIFMAKVMNLKGKEYGFKTDEKAGENLSPAKVKNCIVQAMLFGAEITGNEFNILGGNLYLTKNFCKNWLRKNRVWYKMTPGLSKKIENGQTGQWVIPMRLEWMDFPIRDNSGNTIKEGNRFTENVDIPVNKFANTSEATMRGQAERDAMFYIIEELRKESMPVDKSDDFVETSYVEVGQQKAAQSAFSNNQKEQVAEVINEVLKDAVNNANIEFPKAEQLTQNIKLEMASAELQAEFDAFINNKAKVIDLPSLLKRAKNFVTDKEMKSSQFDMSKYNEIKAAIDTGTWL